MRVLDYILWASLHLHLTGRSLGSAGFMRYYPDADLPVSTISPVGHGSEFRSHKHSHHHSHQKHFQNKDHVVNSRHSLSNHKNHQNYFSTHHNRNINSMSTLGDDTSVRDKLHKQNKDKNRGPIQVENGMGLLWEQQDGISTKIPTGPRFDRSLPRNLTVQVDKTAVLSCRVLNIADKSVAWIRHEDLHILTVDKYRYTTDRRVSTVYNEVNQEWVLRIRKATHEDAGMYECQISTKPILSFIVNMEVVDALQTTPFPKLSDEENQEEILHSTKTVPRASILNGPEIFVHQGSLINLTCLVTHGTDLPVYIYWYHHNKVVEYEGRGDVTVSIEPSGSTVSTLIVHNAGSPDSGKYSCKPSNGQEDAITLHVLQGEHSAPMQTNAGYKSQPTSCWWQVLSCVLMMTIYSQQSSFFSSSSKSVIKSKSNDPINIGYIKNQDTININCRLICSLSSPHNLNGSELFSKRDYFRR